MADEVLLVMSTFPDAPIAHHVAQQIVEERLAACANVLPSIKSIYRWEGKVEESEESLVLIKTTVDQFAAVQTTLRRLHPYEVPEIIALRIDHGLSDYLRWVVEQCAA